MMAEANERYRRPAIAERVPVGDPLIVGVYTLSPKWQQDEPERPQPKRERKA